MNAGAIREYLPLLIPLILIQLGLMAVALVDLARRERVAGGAKWIWVLVIIFVTTIGPLVYFAFGRKD
ncbi:MAG: PLD nuclease N-terminal domain-containing protein [Firmicutes bacterium]|nr:PLD nuclease N-terminal domain-containing protein [Bacillota bacterium]